MRKNLSLLNIFLVIFLFLIFSNFSTKNLLGEEYVFLKDGRVFNGPIKAASFLYAKDPPHDPFRVIYQLPYFNIIQLEHISMINFIEKKSLYPEDTNLISDEYLTVILKDGSHYYAEYLAGVMQEEVYIFQIAEGPRRDKKKNLARIYFPKDIKYELIKHDDGSIEFVLKKTAGEKEVSEGIAEKNKDQFDVEISETEKTEDYKSVIAQCIEKLGGGENIKTEEIRAVMSTLDLYGDLAIDSLLEVLENKDKQDAENIVRRFNTITVLGEIGDKRAIKPLKKLIEGEARNDQEKELAEKSLIRLEEQRILYQRANYTPEDIVIYAFGPRYLNYKKRSIDFLCKALEAHNWEVRLDALAALLFIEEKMDVEPIIKLLKDEHEDIRANAAAVLAIYKDKSSVNSLIEALKDEEEGVRENAIKALEAIGDPSAIEHIEKLEKDQIKYVRDSAKKALKILKKKRKK